VNDDGKVVDSVDVRRCMLIYMSVSNSAEITTVKTQREDVIDLGSIKALPNECSSSSLCQSLQLV
jgi:hypothetical protein